MAAFRADVLVFSVTLTVIVALLDPDEVLTVHHVWSLLTVHDVFDSITNVLLPAEELKLMLLGLTVRTGSDVGVGVEESAFFCVMRTSAVALPVLSERVSLDERSSPVLTNAETVMLLPPVPPVGEYLTHESSALTVQDVLDVTLIVLPLPSASKVIVEGVTVNVGPSSTGSEQFVNKKMVNIPKIMFVIVLLFIIYGFFFCKIEL